MKKFTAQLNGGNYIQVNADEMVLKDEAYIFVYCEKKLVAFLDLSCVLCAHLSEKAVQ